MKSNLPVVIQRILVAFDNSSRNSFTLETAAKMAVYLHSKLHGLFVEDENLLRLADMPFAREIGGTSAISRPLNRELIERTYRAKADEARRALQETAQRVQVQWDFEVCRGQPLQATLAAADDADVMVVEPNSALLDTFPKAFQRMSLRSRSESVSRPLGRDEPIREIFVIMDGSSGAFRALQIALRLSRSLPADLTVLLSPLSEMDINHLRRLTEGVIEDQRAVLKSNIKLVSSVESITETLDVGKQRFRLALLNLTNLIAEVVPLRLLIQQLDCPLALVR